MMKKALQLVILLIFSTVLTNCDAVSSDGSAESGLTPIKEGISFSVQETYMPRGEYNVPVKPHIQLKMATEEVFGCMNYPIISEFNRSGEELNFKIHGVKEGGVCLTALGPATALYELDLNPGEYTLRFNYKGTDHARLTITDSSLTVSADETSFIAPQVKTFWRYPENSFAFLCKSTPDARWMCHDFEQMLNDSLAIDPFSFPDHGVKPYPGMADQYDIAIYYYYPDEATYTKAGAMLNAYADSINTGEEAYLSVINWKNKGFYSWTKIDNED